MSLDGNPDVTFGLFDWVDADGARAFAFGSLTYPEARSSLTRFAEDVAPPYCSAYGDTESVRF